MEYELTFSIVLVKFKRLAKGHVFLVHIILSDFMHKKLNRIVQNELLLIYVQFIVLRTLCNICLSTKTVCC